MSHEYIFKPQNKTVFRREVLSGWKYAEFQTFAHVSVGQRFSCFVLHKRLSLSARKRLFRIAGKPFRHCNKVSFISPDGAFRIVKQAFPHSGMLNTDMLLCENGTVCPFFMSVCHLYTGLLFSVSQISVVKIFYLGNEYICGFVYEKRKP